MTSPVDKRKEARGAQPHIGIDMPAPLVRRKLALPVDFIDCPTCLARIERLIAATDGFVDVSVDFEVGRTTIEYPAPILDPFPVGRAHLGRV